MSGVIRERDVDNRCSPRVSTYDHFSAGLVASIVICGFVVLSLLMVWLFGDQRQALGGPSGFERADPVVPVEDAGLEQELDEVVGGSNSTELVSLLESVENAVSNQFADTGSPGNGDYLSGDHHRVPDPVLEDSHSSRWRVSFEVDGIEQYKRQMDFFGIEIGVIDSRKDDVWRIGKLSSTALVTHSSRNKEQLSTWFAHTKRVLKRWDQQIADESGVSTQDRLLVQFYPEDLVARIMLLEEEALRNQRRELEDVDVTNVRITQSGDEFSISITEFEFR